ncbi:MAG: hypothetical protein ACON5A_02290 [Candidatus Comchoanobacterales bacterium]
MTIENAHRTIIEAVIRFYFDFNNNETDLREEIIQIKNSITATDASYEQYDDHFRHYFHNPMAINGLEERSEASITVGEARQIMIEYITSRIEGTIEKLTNSPTPQSLGWDEQSLLDRLPSMRDHDTPIITRPQIRSPLNSIGLFLIILWILEGEFIFLRPTEVRIGSTTLRFNPISSDQLHNSPTTEPQDTDQLSRAPTQESEANPSNKRHAEDSSNHSNPKRRRFN